MRMMEEKMAGPPSYLGWRTCLEINADARSAEAKPRKAVLRFRHGRSGQA